MGRLKSRLALAVWFASLVTLFASPLAAADLATLKKMLAQFGGQVSEVESGLRVTFYGDKFAPPALDAVVALPDLVEANFFQQAAPLDDAALARLAEQKTLRVLNLGHSDRITNQGLTALGKLTALEVLALPPESKLTDAGLAALSSLTHLRELQLRNREITDAGMTDLAPLKNLRRLNLHDTQVTGEGLAQLAGAPLEYLSINNVTDPNAQHLAKFLTLREVNFNHMFITGEGFQHFAALTNLEVLDISGCYRIPDAAFAPVAAMQKMRRANVHHSGAADAAMQHFAQLPALEDLYINNTRATDAALVEIAKIKSLKRLEIGGDECGMTAQGLAQLKALPNLEELILCSASFDDEALRQAAELPHLTSLHIAGPNYTDTGLEHLPRLGKLQKLKIGIFYAKSPKITERGIAQLSSLTGLAELNLQRGALPAVSEAAIETLQQALPNTKLTR